METKLDDYEQYLLLKLWKLAEEIAIKLEDDQNEVMSDFVELLTKCVEIFSEEDSNEIHH